jgi:hypothetical protein
MVSEEIISNVSLISKMMSHGKISNRISSALMGLFKIKRTL